MPLPSASLTSGDIDRLIADRSSAAQMDVAQKITACYTAEGEAGMNNQQSAIANDIFELLLSRAEVQVRAMLAMNLSQSSSLPPAIARKMVADVSEVAAPILEHSAVLSDDDLIKLINANENTQKLEAIARRASISETISDALVETRIDSVVKTVVENEGAAISDQTFDKITERHSESAEVMGSIFQRTNIPVAVVEKVIERVSDTMRQNLEQKFGNLVELKDMRKALDQSLELASLKMLGFKSSDENLMQLLNQLDGNTKLSPFQALCMGNMELFAVSLSRLLRIPYKNVQILLRDSQGIKAIYEQAELPESMFEAAELAIHAINEIELESLRKTGYKQFCNSTQVMEKMRQLAIGRQVMGLDYLFAMMQHCTRNNIRYRTSAAA